MARTLAEMLAPLDEVVESHDERARSFRAVEAHARALAERLPLIHRTGAHASWREVFAESRLRTREVGSRAEQAHGQTHAVYAFLGSGAYPRGHLALVFERALAVRQASTFTPFDTGALQGFIVPGDGSPWDEAAETHTLQRYQASGSCLAEFAGSYLAAHFRAPLDYVRYPQVSTPDFPAYHGLVSPSGDRRAWTIEVQAPEDILLEPGDTLRWVLLDELAQRTRLPSAYRQIARVIRPDDDETSDFYTLISRWLVDHLLS